MEKGRADVLLKGKPATLIDIESGGDVNARIPKAK
jgi:hypothetical protein